MEFIIRTKDGEHVTEVDNVELETVELEVDTFPEYFTSGELEINMTVNLPKADLLTYFKHRNDYIKAELFGGGYIE